MKKIIILGVAVAFFCTTGLVSMTMAEEDKGPADITLVTEGSAKPKPALFPHAKHQETIKCGDCHHGQDADGKQTAYTEGMKADKCATCHNAEVGAANAEASADKKHVLNSFKNAAHANCKGCHKGNEDKELAKKLAKCTTCHPKKKK